MPVKGFTIDMEACDLLAADKRSDEGFSRVIHIPDVVVESYWPGRARVGGI